MIESKYWKGELKRIATTLRPVRNPARWSEKAHCTVERDLMIGFFIVRRLVELDRVSSVSRDHVIKIFSCPARGKHVHRLNGHRIEELYDLENERLETKKPTYLSNQFVHAYTSYVARDPFRNWSDVYIVSDFDRNNCIWRVPISEIRALFFIVANDYPWTTHSVYNDKKGDYEVTTN